MTNRYDIVAVILHWATALLILFAFGLGLTVDDFPEAYGLMVVNTHALIGLAVLLLTCFRLAWRLGHRAPQPASNNLAAEKVSKIVHVLLYMLMVLVPLIGLPTLFYRGKGLDLGLFAVPQILPRSPDVFHPLTEMHEVAAYALILLAGGHILAAIYHQTVLRDGLILRMTFQQKREMS